MFDFQKLFRNEKEIVRKMILSYLASPEKRSKKINIIKFS